MVIHWVNFVLSPAGNHVCLLSRFLYMCILHLEIVSCATPSCQVSLRASSATLWLDIWACRWEAEVTYRCVPKRWRRTGSSQYFHHQSHCSTDVRACPISCTKTFPFYLCCISQSLNSCFYGSQSWGTPGTPLEYTQPLPSPQPNSGALPVTAPPQSLVADGDIFSMATAVLEHQFPHRDAPLAAEEDHWQWLSGITGRYLYQ